MASGDVIQIIFPNTAITHTFQPAAGVTVMLTTYGNRNGTWGGYASATYPISGTLYQNFNGANTQYNNFKIPVTNTIYFTCIGTVSRYIDLGGIEI